MYRIPKSILLNTWHKDATRRLYTTFYLYHWTWVVETNILNRGGPAEVLQSAEQGINSTFKTRDITSDNSTIVFQTLLDSPNGSLQVTQGFVQFLLFLFQTTKGGLELGRGSMQSG